MPIGLEAAGVIEAIRPNVSGLKVGDAVSVAPAFDTTAYGMYGDQGTRAGESRRQASQ
jgi:NADPH:quinone reductase-like Zn-dependent oxidoreductase